MFLAGTWQIDGQAVAGIEILDRGSDAIEHLAVLADNGKTYTIQGHANIMEDEGEHTWAGWVMVCPGQFVLWRMATKNPSVPEL